MTTSGVITSSLIVSDVVTAAMQELGLLSAGERPTNEELQDCIRVLNWMLKSWQARGITSWRDTEGSATFPAGTATMVLPYCVDVTEARVVQSTTFERPLQRWELAQYRQLPNKAQTGFPTAYTIAKTDASISMTLWPVPNTDTIVPYSYSRISQDVTQGTETLDVPQEWTETVYIGLAARIAQTFGVTRTDPATAQIMAQRSAALEQLLLDSDRPASIYMGSAYGRYF